MAANVMVIIERQFDYPRPIVFRAWTAPEEMMQWRGSPGWHVEKETVSSDLRVGGKHHHVKVRDNDPTTRVTTDAVFTEYFEPDVFVARQRISGDSGIDPDKPLEGSTPTSRWSCGSNSTRWAATARWSASCRGRMKPGSPASTAKAGSAS